MGFNSGSSTLRRREEQQLFPCLSLFKPVDFDYHGPQTRQEIIARADRQSVDEEGSTMVWQENAQVGEFRLRARQFHGAASDSWLAESVGTGDPVRLAGMELPPHLEPLRDQVVAAV